MNNLRTKFVGMGVHQKSISIAIADDGPDGEVRLYGTIKNIEEAIDKVIRKLVSTGAELHFVYEADKLLNKRSNDLRHAGRCKRALPLSPAMLYHLYTDEIR